MSSHVDDIRKGFRPGTTPDRVIGRPLLEAGLLAPFMTLDAESLAANIETMARYCEQVGASLAPHGKTTMSPAVIGRQMAAGAWAITAANPWQALAMFSFGVKRLLLANEVTDSVSAGALAASLEADTGKELLVCVDSEEGVAIVRDHLQAKAIRDRVSILVEVGFPGGRAGARDRSRIDLVVDAARKADVQLVGVTGYEGILHDPEALDDTAVVDTYLDELGHVLERLAGGGALAAGRERVVSAGGSIYFDRVVARLGPIADRLGARLVLRSGCYVTHDDGLYDAKSPFGRNAKGPFRLSPALTLWARVLSRPEPELIIAGFGRRDAPFDHGMPLIRRVRRRDGADVSATGLTVFDLNDQHAYIRTPETFEVGPGDLLECGISHPCSAFDRWRSIPLLDGNGVILEVIDTYF